MQRRSVGRDGAERLRSIPLFEDVSIGQCRMLAELVDEVQAVAGDVLMAEGEQGFELIMLEQGSAEVHQGGELINVMGPGDFFGEVSVLGDGKPRTATVTAQSDVRGLLFTAHFMREVHDRLPAVGARVDEAAQRRVERDRARQDVANS